MSQGVPPAARRTRVMGIVNVTPDSFSDGGRWATSEAAVAHGRHLVEHGADILDIGGESTRPGATRPLVAEELDRVVPVIRELAERLDAVLAAGVPRERVVLDPGLGFAKRPGHNWELLGALDALRELDCPLLVGASRKSFLGSLLAVDGMPRPVDQREHAHVALVTLLALRGVDLLRVHDVRATKDALAVVAAMESAMESAPQADGKHVKQGRNDAT